MQEDAFFLKECITALTNLVVDVRNRYLVGLRIPNTENIQYTVVGISFRRLDQIKPDVDWGLLGKVVQGNARIGLSYLLEVHLYHVRMPTFNVRPAEKTKGRPLNVLSAIKGIIVVLNAAVLCLAHARNRYGQRKRRPTLQTIYIYIYGKCINKPVEVLLKASFFYFNNGEFLEELLYFQRFLSDYRFTVFNGLNIDSVVFTGNSLTNKKFTFHMIWTLSINM